MYTWVSICREKVSCKCNFKNIIILTSRTTEIWWIWYKLKWKMRALIHPYGFLLVQNLVERRLRHLTIVDWNFKQISKESLAVVLICFIHLPLCTTNCRFWNSFSWPRVLQWQISKCYTKFMALVLQIKQHLGFKCKESLGNSGSDGWGESSWFPNPRGPLPRRLFCPSEQEYEELPN